MSQILKKMENNGIIQRTPSKEDGRKVFVSLTEQGNQIVEKAKFSKDEMLKHLIETKLTNEEITMLKKTLPILKKLNSV